MNLERFSASKKLNLWQVCVNYHGDTFLITAAHNLIYPSEKLWKQSAWLDRPSLNWRIPKAYVDQYNPDPKEFRQHRAGFDLAWAKLNSFRGPKGNRLILPHMEQPIPKYLPLPASILYRTGKEFKVHDCALHQSGRFLECFGFGFRGISGAAAISGNQLKGIAIQVNEGSTLILPNHKIFKLMFEEDYQDLSLHHIAGKPLNFIF